jgi:hypothetical protein
MQFPCFLFKKVFAEIRPKFGPIKGVIGLVQRDFGFVPRCHLSDVRVKFLSGSVPFFVLGDVFMAKKIKAAKISHSKKPVEEPMDDAMSCGCCDSGDCGCPCHGAHSCECSSDSCGDCGPQDDCCGACEPPLSEMSMEEVNQFLLEAVDEVWMDLFVEAVRKEMVKKNSKNISRMAADMVKQSNESWMKKMKESK